MGRIGRFITKPVTATRLVAARLRPRRAFEAEDAGFALLSKLARRVAPSYVMTDYAKLWFRDRAFFEAFDRLIPDRNYRSADRKFFLRSLLALVERLPGDTAECGVWTGASSWFICDATKGNGRTHHGFDSFAGLSQPAAADRVASHETYWQEGDLDSSEAIAARTLSDYDVRLYRGMIPDRFPEVADRSFCFVHIDVDLYEPTRDSVSFFYDRLTHGGIMLLDDYGFATCPGATKAIDEFFRDKPEPLVHVPTGQAFIIKG